MPSREARSVCGRTTLANEKLNSLPLALGIPLDGVADIEQDAHLQGEIFHSREIADPLYGRTVVENAKIVAGNRLQRTRPCSSATVNCEPDFRNCPPNGVAGQDRFGDGQMESPAKRLDGRELRHLPPMNWTVGAGRGLRAYACLSPHSEKTS